MLSALKNHPFAVEAFFDSSVVLTFAIPKEQLEPLIPECLTLDTFDDKWAFVAVAMVQTKGLRPKGFPALFGRDFFLIGYRIFVRYTTNEGKRLRGLYIIKSETDKKSMAFFGNIFTHYNYKTTDILVEKKQGHTEISSERSGFHVDIIRENEDAGLPEHSPFHDWKEARRFAGPLPFTFTYDPESKKVLIIEGVRQHWQPAPLQVLDYKFSYLDSLNLKGIVLANAFIIKDIPYYWKKGRIEQWSK
jgi:uncharacterized protein YqjF (DUF2071 family)